MSKYLNKIEINLTNNLGKQVVCTFMEAEQELSLQMITEQPHLLSIRLASTVER